MKIAYFITGLGLGGAEIVTISIANEMIKRGHEVLLVYLGGKNEHSLIINNNIKVIGLSIKKTPFSVLMALLQVRKSLAIFHPDVIHGNMVHANFFVRFLRLIYKIPLIISTEHSKNVESRFRMFIYRYTDFLSDLNTNVSQESTDYFIAKKAFNPKKSIAMHNGIDLSRFRRREGARIEIRKHHNISDNEFCFINVGRFTEAKDHINLLNAFSKIPEGKLIIVGYGHLEHYLRNKINELNLQERVILVKAQQNIEKYYSAADCFVLSSKWEGFGIVIAEAMSCSLPAITTDAGGCREVINDDHFVVPINDSAALSLKMQEVKDLSSQQRETLGKRNRKAVQKFDINTICDKWEILYNSK